MSMENAILVHASALEKLAEAIRSAFGANVALLTDAVDIGDSGGKIIVDAKAAELANATKQRAAATKEAAAKDAQQNASRMAQPSATHIAEMAAQRAEVKPDTELEQAVAEVEKAAKDEQPDDAALANPLDYNKDVKPVLLAAIKRAGKEPVQALIKSYGVDKADKIGEEHLADVLAKAQAL